MYPPVDSRPNFPAMEEEILKFWDEHHIFERSVEQNKGKEPFTFYDGPPFATGLPHVGHIMVGVLKDAVQRYNTMLGKYLPRRFGWDCHGLPVEYEAEKSLGISGKRAIEEWGIGKFNEACRGIVQKFAGEWRRTVRRSGRWVDFESEYRTMDLPYMESIWWVVRQLWDKGLLYRGYYILPYCPRCSTVLSNHDVALGGYRDIHDPALTVRFPLAETARKALPPAFRAAIEEARGGEKVAEPKIFFLAWTTTPWTLPANLGLALHPDFDYALVADEGQGYAIVLRSKVPELFDSELSIRAVAKGKELSGLEYLPLFDYFSNLRENGAFRSHCGEFVTAEDGCGIVHCAPGFGEDDYKLLRAAGVPVVAPIDEECCYTEEVSDFAGRFVRDANKDIGHYLKNAGAVFRQEQILHAYPHCWRCEQPLIYRAISSWFVKVESLRPKMLESNAQIYWVPDHLREGRFGNWLEGARDWSISRNRYWGNPIPIWECEMGHQRCLGSRAELEELTGAKVEDLHKHLIDHLEFACEICAASGQKSHMRRVSEVLDCWFESGAMPYAQIHYPFENKDWFEQNFPAHFINESLDQTRGWFYTLTVLSTALFGRPAFRSCVTSGMILAEDGKKMSKSLRNYTPPDEIMDSLGADALRLYLLSSAVVRGEPIRFADSGVRHVLKSIILPLWNAYSFYVTYANVDGMAPKMAPQNPQNPLDQWILSELETLIERFRTAMEQLFLPQAVIPLLDFIDLLNNWYIRRSRRRFWKSVQDNDKGDAYATLWFVLTQLMRITAPLIPFISEKIFRGLQEEEATAGAVVSVHLCAFPTVRQEMRRPELEAQMSLARRCVSLGRSLRAQQQIRNRQPLAEVRLVSRDDWERTVLEGLVDLIAEELNVKRVVVDSHEEEWVRYSAKANFRVLGKILGKDMKALAAEVEKLGSKDIAGILNGGKYTASFGAGREFLLESEHLDIRRQEKEGFCVLNEGNLTVALQTMVDAELYREGLIRDTVRLVQNLRKEADLHVAERIDIQIGGSAVLKASLEEFGSLLLQETLGNRWLWFEDASGLKNYSIGGEQGDGETEAVWLNICHP
ncbi:MAG: isoleucine--tRNA ligase [Spirochaetota bacterium]